MDHPPLARRHRLEPDRLVVADGALGGDDRLLLEQRPAALAVAGGVERDPLAVGDAQRCGAVAEQLQGVERLAAPADQDPELVGAVDLGVDLVVGLGDLDLGVEVDLVEDAVDDRADALGRLLGNLFDARSSRASHRFFFFFLRGGGGGGFAAFSSSSVGFLTGPDDRVDDLLLAEGPEVGRDPVDRRAPPRTGARTARTGRGGRR